MDQRTMKWLLVALALLLPTAASAQCTGVFAPNTLCGNLGASPAPPAQFSASGTVVGPGSSTTGDIATWGNNTGTLLADPGFGPRIRLTGDLTFYVNGASGSTATCGVHGTSSPLTCSAGSDSNNCLTPATACLTSQHVFNLILNGYDSAGFTITVNGAHCASSSCGTNLAFNCIGADIGTATLDFAGDYDNPTAVKIFAPNGNAAISANDGCTVSIDSVAIADQGSATTGVNVVKIAQIDLRSVTATGTWNTGAVIFTAGGQGAILNMIGVGNGGITNTVNSTSTGQVFQVQNGGAINLTGQTVAIPTAITLAGGQPFVVNNGGFIYGISSGTFTGAGVAGTTGTRCSTFDGYWGATDPNTVFPGNINCSMNRTFNSATIVGPTTGGGTAALFAGSDTIAGKSVANGGTGASAAGATAVGNISGAAPVSCPSGITAGTVVVLNGIVTHC